jgi:hypothetical protein
MTDKQPAEQQRRDDADREPGRGGDQSGSEPAGEPMEGTAYGASSAESGGNYDQAGPTTANIEGETMDADETTSDEPSPS